ncbi:MAG TPA: hypothetical protein VMX33_02220 [bacterium]|nr:hypothetical protein [bacterium]
MKKIALVPLTLAIIALSGACVSSPPPASTASSVQPGSVESNAGTAPDRVDAELDGLVAKARASIDANHLSEGIKFYISALGKATKANKKSRIDEISGTLNNIGARLTVEPHESWLLPDGSQRSGDSRSAAHGTGLMPAVYLYESYGYAKSAVPDAFIRFEFVQNDGNLTASVATDAKGLANTSITSLTAPGKDAVIRAYPVFTSEGYSFAFKSVFRDFGYAAPPNMAVVAALEKTPAGDSANPRVLDAVATSLKPLGVDVVPFNGVLASARFRAAFDGDSTALTALAGTVKAGYFALVYVEVGTPSRMEFQGKVYNIFTANAKATIRIVRADGTVVFAESKDGIRGQGGSDQASIDDCLVKVRDELSAIISSRSADIRKAFAE